MKSDDPIREGIALHEAGHAAVSMALGDGNQAGANMEGWHSTSAIIDFHVLPRQVAVRHAARRALVAAAGPMFWHQRQGLAFDLVELICQEDGEPGSDGFVIKDCVNFISSSIPEQPLIDRIQATTADILADPSVINLALAIADNLMAMDRLTGAQLMVFHARLPTSPELMLIPGQLAANH